MQNEFIHITPCKWQEFNPPSENFLADYFAYQLNEFFNQQKQRELFLNQTITAPFIIGIAGSVAAGKSTFAKKVEDLLNQNYPDFKTAVVSTDGFLMSNNELKAKGLMDQKGFPVSFNWQALNNFLCALKVGKNNVPYRLYSQEISDLVTDRVGKISNCNIVIIEGINILQVPEKFQPPSDFLDLGIYLDAADEDLEYWFMQRFHSLLKLNENNPDNFYYEWAHWPIEKADKLAKDVWQSVNYKNLVKYIAPSKTRADLIIKKQKDHTFSDFYIKKF